MNVTWFKKANVIDNVRNCKISRTLTQFLMKGKAKLQEHKGDLQGVKLSAFKHTAAIYNVKKNSQASRTQMLF